MPHFEKYMYEGTMVVEVLAIALLCAVATSIPGVVAVAPADISDCTTDGYRTACVCKFYHQNSTAILYEGGETANFMHFNLPRLQSTDLFLLARFAISLELSTDERSFDAAAKQNENATLPYRTWIATTSRLYSKLSPLLFDALSVGVLSITARANESELVLPAPACYGKEEEVLRAILIAVLENSKMNVRVHKWTIKEQETLTALQTSEVFLFMSTGLLSVFVVFITAPFCILVVSSTCCRKKKQLQSDLNSRVKPCLSSLFIISALLSPTFLAYWIIVSVCYYTDNTIGQYLFYDQLLAPYSLHLIFYGLTGLVSFLGGFFFSKCQSGNAKMSCGERVGFGLLSMSLSACVYHSFFITLAFLQDIVMVTASLVVFVTIIVLLFLGICSIIYQFGKTRLNGSTTLVITLMIIIFTLYTISVKSFRVLVLEEDSYVATPTWLLMVCLLSVLALSFATSVFVLVLKQQPIASEENRRTPPPPGDVESGRHSTTTIVKLPKDLVTMLPVVVNAWRTREKERKSPSKEKK